MLAGHGTQAEALEPGLTVLETLERAAPDAEMKDIKALLGRMMFSGKAMHKKVPAHSLAVSCCSVSRPVVFRTRSSTVAGWQVEPWWLCLCLPADIMIEPTSALAQVEVLSGGEKARLALAKFMLSQVRATYTPSRDDSHLGPRSHGKPCGYHDVRHGTDVHSSQVS